MELTSIPAWLVGHSEFVISAENVFDWLYGEKGKFRVSVYTVNHPFMSADCQITKFGQKLTGNAYTLNGSPVLTMKGAEYVAMNGAGQMEYERFAKFFQFVADWKKTRVPGTKNVNMYAVKIMDAGEPSAPEPPRDPSAPEPPRDPKDVPGPTMEAQTPTMDSKRIPLPNPKMDCRSFPYTDSKAVPTLQEVMTASTLGSGDHLPGLFKSLLNEYIEMRREFSDERERKDRLIDDLMRKILAK